MIKVHMPPLRASSIYLPHDILRAKTVLPHPRPRASRHSQQHPALSRPLPPMAALIRPFSPPPRGSRPAAYLREDVLKLTTLASAAERYGRPQTYAREGSSRYYVFRLTSTSHQALQSPHARDTEAKPGAADDPYLSRYRKPPDARATATCSVRQPEP